MYQKIKERGGLLELPKEIDGHMIASDPTQIKFLFDLRDSDRDNKLRKAGITPGILQMTGLHTQNWNHLLTSENDTICTYI